MPDKKLTNNEIVKALECYRGQKLFTFNGKEPEIYIHDILDLINRLQEEKQNLEIELKAMRGAANSYKAEIERLQSHIQEGIDLAKQIPEMLALVKVEAYKEFLAKMVERKFPLYVLDEAKNILKNLEGENNETTVI